MEIRPIEATRPANVDSDIYEPAADLRRIGGVIRRQYKLAIVGACVAAAMALLFLQLVQPLYLSSVSILLDLGQNQLLADSQKDQGTQSAATVEDFVATQMAVIGSEVVARRVARTLDLTYDPGTERLSAKGSPAKDTRVSPSEPGGQTDPVDPAVVGALIKALSVFQVDKSMVIEIDVTDPDPVLAEAMASAYGQAYLDDQLGARYDSARNAGNWLENRIVRLRNQSLEANAEVESFRKQNNLVSTDGRLVSDQQLQQLNDRLSEARSNVTRAAARETVFANAVDTRNIDAILSQIASMPGITADSPILQMRNDYLQANERYRDVTGRWGPDNDQAKAIKIEVDRLSSQILGEASRIRDGLKGDVRVAKSEVDAITSSVQAATGQYQADNSTLVQLRNLEQRATSYNLLYQDYLARYQEAVQQQTLSLTTGRQISQAQQAHLPVFPKTKIVLALAIFLGIAFGGAAGIARELMDTSFRTGAAIERLGVPFLGYVSRIRRAGRFRRKGPAERISIQGQLSTNASRANVLAKMRIAIGMRHREVGTAIGLISVEPCAARSELVFLLARGEAAKGNRVLLIDGDMESRRLTDLVNSTYPPDLRPDPRVGRFDSEAVAISEGLDFQASEIANDGTLLSDRFTPDFIAAIRKHYEMILVDLPPAESISEARSLATMFDAFICIVEWGQTPTERLRTLLAASSNIRARLVGAVLVVSDSRHLKAYDSHGARHLLERTR